MTSVNQKIKSFFGFVVTPSHKSLSFVLRNRQINFTATTFAIKFNSKAMSAATGIFFSNGFRINRNNSFRNYRFNHGIRVFASVKNFYSAMMQIIKVATRAYENCIFRKNVGKFYFPGKYTFLSHDQPPVAVGATNGGMWIGIQGPVQ